MTYIEKWEDLNINQHLLRGIYGYGFEKPSPIQQKAISPIFDKKDIIAQAQSGTGKTGCFTIGTLQNIDTSKNVTQAIIISPTRELSTQIYNVTKELSVHLKNINIKLLVGGTSIDYDINDINNNVPHIVIGCPGRIYDMIKRKHIKTEQVSIVVLDEADEMLSMGFKEQIYDIFQYLSNHVQICLFCATIPQDVELLTNQFMRDPVKILVKAEQLTLEGIKQFYVALDNNSQKFETLKDLYSSISVSQTIIYCNTSNRVEELYQLMLKENFSVSRINGSMDKNDRKDNYKDFTTGKTRILISSDVTARGIDIQQVSTVINYDIPKCNHIYLHRIGRSGRWGRKGVGINFTIRFDFHRINDIEAYYNTSITELQEDFIA